MKGLKTQEEKKFEKYFALVEEEAKKRNCVFFAYAGEGNVTETNDLECEDMMGWLIPAEKSDEFERVWKESHSDSMPGFDDFFCWAEYKFIDGHINIHFEFYEDYDAVQQHSPDAAERPGI